MGIKHEAPSQWYEQTADGGWERCETPREYFERNALAGHEWAKAEVKYMRQSRWLNILFWSMMFIVWTTLALSVGHAFGSGP